MMTKYSIVKAEYVGGYKILFTFADGQHRLADFYPFLSGSNHPLINKFLDIELFKQFCVESWAVRWGDNECDLDPYEIYLGEFEAADSPYLVDIQKINRKSDKSHHAKEVIVS